MLYVVFLAASYIVGSITTQSTLSREISHLRYIYTLNPEAINCNWWFRAPSDAQHQSAVSYELISIGNRVFVSVLFVSLKSLLLLFSCQIMHNGDKAQNNLILIEFGLGCLHVKLVHYTFSCIWAINNILSLVKMSYYIF